MSSSRPMRVETIARALHGASESGRSDAAGLLASTDPYVLRALADHLVETAPDVLVAALAEGGVLRERRRQADDGFAGQVTDPDGRTVAVGRATTWLRQFTTKWSEVSR